MYTKWIATELEKLIDSLNTALAQLAEALSDSLQQYVLNVHTVITSIVKGQLPVTVLDSDQNLDIIDQYSQQLSEFISSLNQYQIVRKYTDSLARVLAKYCAENGQENLERYLDYRAKPEYLKENSSELNRKKYENETADKSTHHLDGIPLGFMQKALEINLNNQNFAELFENALTAEDVGKILLDEFIHNTRISLGKISANLAEAASLPTDCEIELSIETLLKLSGYISQLEGSLLFTRHTHSIELVDMYKLAEIVQRPLAVLRDKSPAPDAAEYILVLDARDADDKILFLPVKLPETIQTTNNSGFHLAEQGQAYVPTSYGVIPGVLLNPEKYEELYISQKYLDATRDYINRDTDANPYLTPPADSYIYELVTEQQLNLAETSRLSKAEQTEIKNQSFAETSQKYDLIFLCVGTGYRKIFALCPKGERTVIGILVWQNYNFDNNSGKADSVSDLHTGNKTILHSDKFKKYLIQH
ncbi:MAG: hypothetical protein LBL50_00945 [Candidatus Margulisbacteria bacterium]|jgi:hypothetical protein|nr:hypothetical protein [Candidatus Margulisiibacteriota bacterium]